MKIGSIGTKISNYFSKQSYNREQKKLGGYVKIHGSNFSEEVVEQLNTAKSGIAKYAKDKNVVVDIFDASSMMDEQYVNNFADYLKDKLVLRVSNAKTIKTTEKVLSADVNNTTTHNVKGYFVVDYPADGIQQTRITTSEYEDNFLRRIYRSIAEMTSAVNK